MTSTRRRPGPLPAIQAHNAELAIAADHATVAAAAEAATDTPKSLYPHSRFAISQFLTSVVPTHCLTHLRFLELVFPPYIPGAGWPDGPQHPATQKWIKTARHVWKRKQINAAALTVRLVFADLPSGVEAGAGGSGGWLQHVNPVDLERLLESVTTGYQCVLGPLRWWVRGGYGCGHGEKDRGGGHGGGGLAGFYVQAAHPWRWTHVIRRQRDRQTRGKMLAGYEAVLNPSLEREVRGHELDPGCA